MGDGYHVETAMLRMAAEAAREMTGRIKGVPDRLGQAMEQFSGGAGGSSRAAAVAGGLSDDWSDELERLVHTVQDLGERLERSVRAYDTAETLAQGSVNRIQQLLNAGMAEDES